MQLKKYPVEAVMNKATNKKGLAFLITQRNNWITNRLQTLVLERIFKLFIKKEEKLYMA